MQQRVVVLGAAFGLLIAVSEVQAKAGPFEGYVDRPGSNVTEDWQGYGDSIMAGFCGVGCQRDSYLVYYARAASEALDANIAYDSDAVSGNVTSQIRGQMSASELRNADAVIWSAGGNDFLAARGDFRGNCNVGALENATGFKRATGEPIEPHRGWVAQWDSLLARVDDNVRSDARVRTMNVYYPGVNDDLSNDCSGTTHFQSFLPLLLAAGDYMCNTAWERGYDCANSIWAMNCDLGAIQDCPTSYAEWVSLGGEQFDGNFGDPRALGKMTSDNIHPNQTGHRDIGTAHDLLGY